MSLTLGAAVFNTPLVGFTEDAPLSAHRVELDGLPIKEWATATHCVAVCGSQVKILAVRWKDLRTRGSNVSRCPACRTWRKATS